MMRFTSLRALRFVRNALFICLACAHAVPALALKYLDVWEFRVEGNTVLSQQAIANTLQAWLGAARTVDDIDAAAQALQSEYRAQGYATVFVSVPEQDVLEGIVRLQVNESRLRRVTVNGSRYFTLSGIREHVPSLRVGDVVHLPTLQEELQQANQANPDLKVIPVVQQGPTAETVDVELSVADESPLHGGVSISNYNTAGTTPSRLSAQMSYGNLWQKNHQLALQGQVSPENTEEVQVLAVSYTLPVGSNGDKLALYGVASDSDIATVGDVNVIGDGTILGFRYVLPFAKSGSTVHSVSLGADYKNFNEDLVLIDGSTQQTPIEYATWSALYNLYSNQGARTDELAGGLTFGIRGFPNDDGEFNEKRAVASPSFALLTFDWKRSYNIGKDWLFSHQLRTQLADSPLVSNEQFSVGGSGTVRGYYESQIQGDFGLVFGVEFITPELAADLPPFNSLKALWFYDYAQTHLQDVLAGQEDEFSIASTGLGLRTQLFDVLDLVVDGGYALKDQGEVEAGEVRARARLSVEF